MNVHSRLARNVLLQLSAEGSINQLKLEIMNDEQLTKEQLIKETAEYISANKLTEKEVVNEIKFLMKLCASLESIERCEQASIG